MDVLAHVKGQLDLYLACYPADRDRLGELRRRIQKQPAGLYDRSCMDGHITASGLLLSPDRQYVLMIEHIALMKTLQPGGHYEPPEYLVNEAIRETREEAGVRKIRPFSSFNIMPIDVDTHHIPENPKKGEGAHLHHDFLYLLCLDQDEPLTHQEEEVSDVKWVLLSDLSKQGGRLQRAALRAIEIVGSGSL